jgi:AsmA protein
MPATLSLSPELIARRTGGRARPKSPIPVTFRLGGPIWRPRVEALSLDAAVKAIGEQAAAGAVGKALGVEGDSVKDVAEKKREEAEARARDEAQKKRQELEEEAKKRLKGLFGK